MEYCSLLIVSILNLLVLCYAGDHDVKLTLNVPESIILEEPASGSCIVSNLIRSPRRIIVKVEGGNGVFCIVKYTDKNDKPKDLEYQQNFTVTCKKGSPSFVGVKCFILLPNKMETRKLKVLEKPTVEPKIINEPENITTGVGLPVTLKCYVKGDPSHYIVGWISRNTVIQEGKEYSMSTSPSFKSTNGTAHYLTIHTVKVSDKYYCNVYTIENKVADQVTHQILIDNENDKSTPPSFFSIFSKLFF